MNGFQENFEKLNLTDQERFSQLTNYLLAHTFLLSKTYDFSTKTRPINEDYIFVERNLELFQDYLSFAGFRLTVDTNYGVMTLESDYDGTRVRFDKFTTIMLYSIRLIYEEEREKLTLNDAVFITTGDIVKKMIAIGVLTKKPADRLLRNSLRLLGQFNLVQKDSGPWERAETRYAILPSILFVVSNEQIKNIDRLVDGPADEDGEEE